MVRTRPTNHRPDIYPDARLAAAILGMAADQCTIPEIIDATGASRDVVRGYLRRFRLRVPDGRVANGYRRGLAAPCGTLTAYTRGCRCAVCRRAMGEYQRERREDLAYEDQ
jgi:hypothetical protein